MASIGYFLSSEEHDGRALVEFAQMSEAAGFRDVLISDHFHPWSEAQGHSPFVWPVTGGIAATTDLRITTGVTCPTRRVHPAIVAQAAATMGELSRGRFRLGVGSGEALNEHIFGEHWPMAGERLEMLEEAVEVIRALWTGRKVQHRGRHYTVENARLYTLPGEPVEIIVSAFGQKATALAARIGDGLVTAEPDRDLVGEYKGHGGTGPLVGYFKVCWGRDQAEAEKLAHHLWANEKLPGELNQVLSTPAHIEQAASLVSVDMIADAFPCGPDPERYVQKATAYFDAGFDELYFSQIGSDQEGFLRFWQDELRPRLAV
ncbi:MAG: TIGR03557 family F420-dependent LLM class oxidoreductase [Acidimicrobiales bacterium]